MTFRAVTDTALVTQRNLKRLIRTPQLLVFSTIQPVMFTLLFVYVFGGAIRTPGLHYVDYLLPGILVQTTLFGGSATAIGLSQDLREGMIDRFRSLPMSRMAVLADLLRNVFVICLILGVGSAVGFRFHGSFGASVAAFLLALLFGYAFSWCFAVVALLVKEPESAQVASLLAIFPLVFASSAFVPTASMPEWLQVFTRHQPVSITVGAVRALTQGTGAGTLPWASVAWSLGILAVAAPLAVARYRRL